MESSQHPTRVAILEKALAAFSEDGFEKTSFKSIMAGSGHPPSLLVYHFGTKENLYLETFKHLFSIYPFRVAAAPRPEPADREEVVRRLEEQIRVLTREVVPDPSRPEAAKFVGAKLWMRELEDPRPILHDLLRHQLAPFVQNIRECMRLLHPDLPEREADFLGVVLVGHVVGHTTMYGLNQVIWGQPFSEVAWDRAIELIVQTCLRGFIDPV